MTKADRLHENIAAISGNIHGSAEYEAFYERYADRLSGFPGIWRHCIEAAEAFTKAEGRWQWDGEYVEAIDSFTTAILQADDLLFERELYVLAVRCIAGAILKDFGAEAQRRYLRRKDVIVDNAAAFEAHQAADPHCTCNDCIEDFARKSDASDGD